MRRDAARPDSRRSTSGGAQRRPVIRSLQRLARHGRSRPGFAVLGLLLVGAGFGAVNANIRDAEPARSAPAAVADTIPVYGPRPFATPSGGTAVHAETFTVEIASPGQYVLRVDNGVGGADSVSVWLNGYAVVEAADLAGGATALERVVELRTENTIEVHVTGAAGAFVDLSILMRPDPSFIVFGPERYDRHNGQPQTDTEMFTLPAGAAPPYRIHIVNGGLTEADRVSSGTIVLNGTTILTSSDLNKNMASLVREVTLSAQNTLELTLKGDPDGYMTVRLTATDTTPPLLELASPADSAVVSATEVEVTGTVSDQTATTVSVNGEAVAVDGSGGFAVTVPLGSEGENTLTVVATDAAGQETSLTRTVIRDTESPLLTLAAPEDGAVTREDSVAVSGTAIDATEVSVDVNGLPLAVDAAGGFSGAAPLAPGVNFLTVTAVDAAGNTSSTLIGVTHDSDPPVLTLTEPVDGAVVEGDSVTVAGTVEDLTEVTLTANGSPLAVDAAGAFTGAVALVEGPNTITVVAVDAAGNEAEEVRTVTRESADADLPPDPASVAPPLDPTVATTLHAASEFLYTGADPIQTGVAPGTIDPVRVAVLRGRVLTRDGAPLSGVVVSVHDRPELGQTLSRADGMYDLAVNGGGRLVLDFEKDGYLPAQRPVETLWQDWAFAEDVALVPLDTAVTAIDLTDTTAVQVARGSVVADADGPRQATLLFEPGTTAELVLPDGSTQPITTLSVRATEYTVGEGGPAAMPAPLPPTSGYTYAVELSADEALSAGAESVVFSRPVPLYIENFLGFPVGLPVPLAAYDFDGAAWVPMDNGRIVGIVGTSPEGLATLDVDGDSVADADSVLAALGITAGERERLAALYVPGQSLWRMPVPHFSPIDGNFPVGSGPGRQVPDENDKDRATSGADEQLDDACEQSSSIIECENQVLGQRIAITGTPFTLNYRSSRVPGWKAGRTLTIPLMGTVPDSLRRIILNVRIAGQVITDTFPPEANQTVTVEWDGLDVYGRPASGVQAATVEIGYVYRQLYLVPPEQARSFGLTCQGDAEAPNGPGRWPSCIIPPDLNTFGTFAREEAPVWQIQRLRVGAWQAPTSPTGLGGWTLSVHHGYDPVGRMLNPGEGGQLSAVNRSRVGRVTAGNGEEDYTGDGGAAREAALSGVRQVAVAPDGSFYLADTDNCVVRRVDIAGVITTFAGTGTCGYAGDGGPATAAQLSPVQDVALGPDGSLYIADASNAAVRRVDPAGTITTVAGTGEFGYSGDGGPASLARLGVPIGVAVDGEGSLYIADPAFSVIRRMGPDGTIATVAGTGDFGDDGDGGPAMAADLMEPVAVALGPDGSLYIADQEADKIRRVTRDGMITTVAGSSSSFGDDGGPATEASLSRPVDVAVAADGSFYIAEAGGDRVRWVGPDGIITTAAGVGFVPLLLSNGSSPDEGRPPQTIRLREPAGVALRPDGTLYIADAQDHRVWRISAPLPGFTAGDALLAREDGAELYRFSAAGRHLATLDALTGVVLYTFGYDSVGRLVSVSDVDGLVTTIEREADGAPTAIVSPFGVRTVLAHDSAGYLASITNPAGEATSFGYEEGGLLAGMTDPRHHTKTYEYDDVGRLIRAEDGLGGFRTLVRTETEEGHAVAHTTALGRSTTYGAAWLATGDRARASTSPAGLTSTSEIGEDGTRELERPDGTTVATTLGPDPRFGMQAPVAERVEIETPDGLFFELETFREVELADPDNPLSLLTQTDFVSVNGREFTSTFDAAARTLSRSTPEGRGSVAVLDSLGRVLVDSVAGLLAVRSTYDSLGFLVETVQGARTTTFGYDSAGLLAAVTDPLGRTDSLFYDAAGRLIRQKFADGRELALAYDSAGNLTSLAPPGRPAHTFGYTALGEVERYAAPPVGPDSTITRFRYNLDRQLTHVIRPGGDSLVLAYDSAGRPSAVSFDRGLLTYGYSPSTGNLETLTAPGGNTLAYTYDGSLPLTETWSGEIAGSVAVGYDDDFRVASQRVNGAGAIFFFYDDDGLLTGILSGSGAGEFSITRRADNGLIGGTSLGALVTARSHNGFGELDTLAALWSDSELFRASYTRDDLGRITELVETVQGAPSTTSTFAYDSAGRLEQVTRDGVVVEAYEYDSNGNRLRATYPSGTLVGSYDAQDRLTSYGDATYTYAPGGELEEKAVGADTTRYTYDQLGNLTQVELPDGRVVEYVIDGRNRRVGRRVDGALTHGWLYQDQLNPVAELDSAGNVVARFVYGTRANVPDYMVRGGNTYRIVSDHLGSVRLVVEVASGAVVQRIDYDAFGRVTLDTNPGFQPFGYAGGLYDSETGLVRFGARDYDPHTGRWTAKDPIEFAGGDPNLYGYVLGDPVNVVDPEGNVAILPVVAGIAVGLVFDYAVEKVKQFICDCTTAGTPLGPAGNAAIGAARGLTGPYVRKPRGGVGGGGPSGSATSVASEINHALSNKGVYSRATRNLITRGTRLLSRAVGVITAVAATFQLYDAVTCR